MSGIVSSDLNIIPSNDLNDFLIESNNLSDTVNESQPDEFPHIINSKYYDNHSFNHIKPDSFSTLGILHTRIFINSIEYLSHSDNLTIQFADHLFQFVLLEGFFKDLVPKKVNFYERNFKNFVDREFNEALSYINSDEILLINENDPNVAINNFHHINYLLDQLAPYKKLSKKELKLKSKPWINNLILIEINKRDKLLHKYSKMKNKDSYTASIIFDEYKKIRNIVTKLKRDSKLEYYHKFFEDFCQYESGGTFFVGFIIEYLEKLNAIILIIYSSRPFNVVCEHQVFALRGSD